jgi:hypothetical protein
LEVLEGAVVLAADDDDGEDCGEAEEDGEVFPWEWKVAAVIGGFVH